MTLTSTGLKIETNVMGFCKEPKLDHYYYMTNDGIYEFANDTPTFRTKVNAAGQLKCDFNKRYLIIIINNNNNNNNNNINVNNNNNS